MKEGERTIGKLELAPPLDLSKQNTEGETANRERKRGGEIRQSIQD